MRVVYWITRPDYRYFMVFRNKTLGVDGAYTMDQFAEIMKEL